MNTLLTNINWLAVGVSFVLSFVLGYFWYSPKLFGTKWAEGVGVKIDPDCEKGPMVAALLTQLIATFLLALLVGVHNANQAHPTMLLTLLVILFLMAAGGLFSQKSAYAIRTELGFVLAMVIIMVACQSLI